MPEIDKKQRIKNRMLNYFVNYFLYILLIIFIVFFLMSFTFILWPKYKNINFSLIQKKTNMNSEIELKKSELDSLNAKKKEMDNIDEYNLHKLNAMIPSKENISDIIKELNIIASNNEFFLMDVRYSKNSDKQKTTDNVNILPVDIKFFTFNITITGGGYQNLKSFLKMFADSVNIRDITSIRFDGKNSYEIELKAYYYEKAQPQAESSEKNQTAATEE